MVSSVKIIIDTRSKKKDKTHPLKLRIVHNRSSKHISLGYCILEKDWDEKGQKVKSSCKQIENVNRFNALLNKEKQKALDVITRLQSEGRLETLSFEEIKKMIVGKETELMTLAFGEEMIAQLHEGQKHGNARVYDTMVRSIRTYAKGKDFPMRQITYSWLKKYEAWYLSKGNSLNGLSVSLRTLRALFNQAIKQKKISAEYYPFKDYTIQNEKTRKRAISKTDVDKIKEFVATTKRQERTKDYFLMSFYLMGASFVDLAFLKVKNIIGGRLEYKRKKTGQLHSITISPALQELLNKYMDGKAKEDFILNVIKSDEPKEQLVNVRDELRRYNKTLKIIGKACGIEAEITSYVSRHSYATIAKRKGVPIAVISEAMGHTSEEVTQIYLDSFDNEVLDNYHNMIIE